MLVSKCRIKDSRARSVYYKSTNDKKSGSQNHVKSYVIPDSKDKKKTQQKSQSGGGAPTSLRCYKYGEFGHRISEYTSVTKNCFKCKKPGHRAAKCRSTNEFNRAKDDVVIGDDIILIP